MIVGRAHEQAEIHRLIDDARSGVGRVLVLDGPPGMGKSTLLELAHERSTAMVVLRSCGTESESNLPFGSLADLLGPLLGELDVLPEPQRAALRGALAIGPPVDGGGLAVAVATLNLIRSTAARVAVLVLIDDAQWLDEPSASVLSYVLRRIDNVGAGVIVATRDDDTRPAWLDHHPVEAVTPLDHGDARTLLGAIAADIVPSVAAALLDVSSGNPLVLIELVGALDASQRTGAQPINEPLRTRARLGSLFERRVRQLDRSAHMALLVAALMSTNEIAVLMAALAALGLDVSSLDVAESRGLVSVADGRISFAHPLVRSAAFHVATASARQSAHAVLADVGPAEARGWHLAAARPGPSAEVADALDRTAALAMARRAHGVASSACHEAAMRSVSPSERVDRLVSAASLAHRGGDAARALSLMDLADEQRTLVSRSRQLRIDHQRGLSLMVRGQLARARPMLVDAAEAAADELCLDERVQFLADAANACMTTADMALFVRLAREAEALLSSSVTAPVRARALSQIATAAQFEADERRVWTARDALDELVPVVFPNEEAGRVVPHALYLRATWGDYEQVLQRAPELISISQTAGELRSIPYLMVSMGEAYFRTGEWEAADEILRRAVAAADDSGLVLVGLHAQVHAAWLSAVRGDHDRARQQVEALGAVIDVTGARLFRAYLLAVLGVNAVSERNVVDAAAHFWALIEHCRVTGGTWDPSLGCWHAEAVEAFLAGGYTDKAQELLRELRQLAERGSNPIARTLCARAEGVLGSVLQTAGADEVRTTFDAALASEQRRPMPFERARIFLSLAEHEQRRGQMRRARQSFSEAADGFAQLGARPWLDRALAGLAVTGGRRRQGVERVVNLTARERDIAVAVSHGRTNREIAAELFVSTKTVEFHLGHLFTKTGSRNRTELAHIIQHDPQRWLRTGSSIS